MMNKAEAEKTISAIRQAEAGKYRARELEIKIAESHLDEAAKRQASVDLANLQHAAIDMIDVIKATRAQLISEGVKADHQTPCCQTLKGLLDCLQNARSSIERDQVIVAANIASIEAEALETSSQAKVVPAGAP